MAKFLGDASTDTTVAIRCILGRNALIANEGPARANTSPIAGRIAKMTDDNGEPEEEAVFTKADMVAAVEEMRAKCEAIARQEGISTEWSSTAARRIADRIRALREWTDKQCNDCGYPLGDEPVFLGGVWFCATCNPAISPYYGQ